MKSGPAPSESPRTTDAPTSTSRRTVEPRPETPPQKPAAGGFRYGKWVFGISALAFFGWIGVRVSEATQTKQAVAVERNAVAEQAKEAAQKPREVRVVHGTAETTVPSVSFEGSLVALEEADLGFKVPGRLSMIRARVGDKVKRGSVLAQLDAGEAAAQLKAAEAQLRAAEAQLALAADSHARTEKVVSAGVQPESLGVQAAQQKSLAEAQRDGANAQLLLARQSLGNQTITAPFDGTVTRAPNGTGTVVSPGTPLFHIADLSRLKLVGSVSAQDAALVRVGTPVEIVTQGRVTAQGAITAVVAALDEVTKRMPVQAVIENGADSNVVAGTLVRAQVRGTEKVSVVRLPHTVLKPGSQDEILVVEDERLVSRRIAFSIAPDGALLVRSGVSPTDAVLESPWPEATTGLQVRSSK